MKNVWEALADKTRREILDLLKLRPHTAGELADQFSLSAATVSHHIAVLKECGLITGERRAQTIVYHLNTTVIEDMMRSLSSLLDRSDKKRH